VSCGTQRQAVTDALVCVSVCRAGRGVPHSISRPGGAFLCPHYCLHCMSRCAGFLKGSGVLLLLPPDNVSVLHRGLGALHSTSRWQRLLVMSCSRDRTQMILRRWIEEGEADRHGRTAITITRGPGGVAAATEMESDDGAPCRCPCLLKMRR